MISSLILFLIIIGTDFEVLFREKEYSIESVFVGFQIVLPLLFFVGSVWLFLNAIHRRLFTLIDREKWYWVYLIGISFGIITYFYATEFFKYFLLVSVMSLALFSDRKKKV